MNTKLDRLLVKQEVHHPDYDLPLLTLAIVSVALMGATGIAMFFAWPEHLASYFNYITAGFILVQALIGACRRLVCHYLWVAISAVISVALLGLTIRLAS